MISCQSCGNQNPIGTRYCRRCGTKIEFTPGLVLAAVQREQAAAASSRWFEHGRSALTIGLFLLTCALVLRYAVVPPMPAAEVPAVGVGSFLPRELPKPEAKSEAQPAPKGVPKR
jgi:hypothetical protein